MTVAYLVLAVGAIVMVAAAARFPKGTRLAIVGALTLLAGMGLLVASGVWWTIAWEPFGVRWG